MIRILSASRSIDFCAVIGMALLGLGVASTVVAGAQEASVISLTEISSDPFTVAPGQHATEVEPHVLANGTTLVAAFQTGRICSRRRDGHWLGNFDRRRQHLDAWISPRPYHRKWRRPLQCGQRSCCGL